MTGDGPPNEPSVLPRPLAWRRRLFLTYTQNQMKPELIYLELYKQHRVPFGTGKHLIGIIDEPRPMGSKSHNWLIYPHKQESLLNGAQSRTRTGTALSHRGILSPNQVSLSKSSNQKSSEIITGSGAGVCVSVLLVGRWFGHKHGHSSDTPNAPSGGGVQTELPRVSRTVN